MKTCPVCALDVEDTYLFCPDDGSSLDAISRTSVNESANPSEVDDEKTGGAVLLYCPTCAAEYPLTFSECPAHGVKLTRHNISRLTDKAAATTAAKVELKEPAVTDPTPPAGDLTQTHSSAPEDTAEPALADSAAGFDYPRSNPIHLVQESATESSYPEPLAEANEQGFERPGFRVAAIATVIALAVFTLVGASKFLSSVSRRPTAPVARIMEAAPQPFVPTPQEAQDYKEEEPAPVTSKPPESKPDRTAEQKKPDASLPAERNARYTAADQSKGRPAVESRLESSNPVAKTSIPPMPALPRGNSGGFDARLIRVRSSKTTSGFRYDLTFNMQEQAGRSTQWQRVLITTRSVSGVNHSQAVPFAHRLGAAGALTFTISVELAGRSEADWQGRVVCTTLGWDNQGAALQTSFGATLTP